MIAELERMHGQLDKLARSLDHVWREKETTRATLESERRRHAEEIERERARGRIAEEEARAAAARIVADAEEQGARIRADAGRRVADAATRLEHLLRVREQVLGELRGILQAYGSLLEQVEHGESLSTLVAQESTANATPEPPPAPIAVAGSGDLFPRRVELIAGPFSDFAELSAFERSLARLPKVEDVYVRRFGDDRAEIELTLAEERPLVHDLTQHLPYRVAVAADDGRLEVQIGAEAAGASG